MGRPNGLDVGALRPLLARMAWATQEGYGEDMIAVFAENSKGGWSFVAMRVDAGTPEVLPRTMKGFFWTDRMGVVLIECMKGGAPKVSRKHKRDYREFVKAARDCMPETMVLDYLVVGEGGEWVSVADAGGVGDVDIEAEARGASKRAA